MNNSEQISIKQFLFNACLDNLNKRISIFKKAVDEAQQAANDEEKSSAGDKYETSRAMSHNTRDMNAKQLEEAFKDLSTLHQINSQIILNEVKLGSIAKTKNGNYFISVSGGTITFNNEKYFAVSAISPIAQAMLKKNKNETFLFRGEKVMVIDVF